MDTEYFGGLVDGFELNSLEDRVKLPYVLKDKLLISPGVHNGYTYTPQALEKIFKNTSWDNETLALFYDHFDMQKGGGARTWIGDIKNIKFNQGCVYGDVNIVDKQAAINLEYGAKFGISAKVNGKSDMSSHSIVDGVFGNWSLVFKPADKRAYLNSVQEDWITLLNFEEVKMAEECVKPKDKEEDVSEMKKLQARLEAIESQIKKDKSVEAPKENEVKIKDGGTSQGNSEAPMVPAVPAKEKDDDEEKEMQSLLAQVLSNADMSKFISAKLSEGMSFKNAAKAWTLESGKISDAKVNELQRKVEELQLQVQPEKVASKSAPSDVKAQSPEEFVAMLSDKELDKAFLDHVMRPESGKARFD